MANHTSAAPIRATGSNEPQFNKAQPLVVTSTPDANDVMARVANMVTTQVIFERTQALQRKYG
jgi:hypothetical protein